MLATGKITGEHIRDYHKSDGVSHSKLKVFARSPLLYKRTFIDRSIPRDDERGEGAVLGSALGDLLEGGVEAFGRDFVVNHRFKDFKTDEAKNWRVLQEDDGKTILSKAQLATVLKMQQAVLAHPDAAALMTGGEPEVTFRLKLNRFHVQARADRWHEDPVALSDGQGHGPLVVELKTTASICPEDFTNFPRQFHALGYYRQAALYREVIATVMGMESLPELLYVVVENQEPFGCVVYSPDPAALNLARAEIKRHLVELRDCYERDVWPGAPLGIQGLSLPPWFMKQQLRALDAAPLQLR